MTTIVWDGEYIACDSQATKGSERLDSGSKITRLENGNIVGFCGGFLYMKPFFAWIDSTDGEMLPDELFGEEAKETGWQAIEIERDGSINHYYPDGCIPFPPQVMCIGSGSQYAKGAISAEKNAMDAVRIASIHDTHTSGTIYCIRLEDFDFKAYDLEQAKSVTVWTKAKSFFGRYMKRG